MTKAMIEEEKEKVRQTSGWPLLQLKKEYTTPMVLPFYGPVTVLDAENQAWEVTYCALYGAAEQSLKLYEAKLLHNWMNAVPWVNQRIDFEGTTKYVEDRQKLNENKNSR